MDTIQASANAAGALVEVLRDTAMLSEAADGGGVLAALEYGQLAVGRDMQAGTDEQWRVHAGDLREASLGEWLEADVINACAQRPTVVDDRETQTHGLARPRAEVEGHAAVLLSQRSTVDSAKDGGQNIGWRE